jgi:uroporphyrinogen III methyltransferase/synthase
VKPLAGRRVLVTRPGPQAGALVDALRAEGAVTILLPTIAIRPAGDLRPLDAAIARLADYAWLAFTSANGVDVFWDRLRALGTAVPAGVRIAAVGTATARALAERGATVDFVPDEFVGARLGATLPDVEGRRVLLARASLARVELADALAARGALVDDVAVYDTIPEAPDPEGLAAVERGVDAATFTSASTVRNFATLLGLRARPLLDGVAVACIGPVTADEARSLGFTVHVEPEEHTIPALVRALSDHFDWQLAGRRGAG